MSRAFSDITFTERVKAAQTLYGSREANQGFELAEDARNTLGERERTFVEARDSFYQATVGENGWPYVQHRGGPVGFLKVLDERTIAFADFRGNVQYLSVGNLMGNDRISLILMDYPNRRRLKIWGRARILHEHDDPELFSRVEMSGYRAPVERLIVITVMALDWNCPKHITPRFSDAELNTVVQPLNQEIANQSPVMSRPPLPPFTRETAIQKIRMAEDGWNSRDPERVALVYTEDSEWRNRAEFPRGRAQIVEFLRRKWAKELDYRLIKELWAYLDNRIAVRFAYEWHDDSGNWFRSYGNENWEFNAQGLMQRRFASINDMPISESERKYFWPLGRRPDDHPGLSELGL